MGQRATATADAEQRTGWANRAGARRLTPAASASCITARRTCANSAAWADATPKAKRPDAQRESLREFLRREVDPARVWAAIEAGLESGNDRDRLPASKLLLTELYEPAAERQREEEAEVAAARARFALDIEELSVRRTLATLVERGLIRPGGGRPFAGVVRAFSDHRERAQRPRRPPAWRAHADLGVGLENA